MIDSELPAIVVRRAAALLRKRAGAASKGPWKSWQEGRDHRGGDSMIGTEDVNPGSGDIYVSVGRGYHTKWEADQDYIASMNPRVGLALADWLEDEAVRMFSPANQAVGRHALIVARAYLEEQ